MLAGHEPEQDPRCIWVAESAKQAGYDCLVLGYAYTRPRGKRSVDGFQIRRIVRKMPHSERFLDQLSEALPAVGALFNRALDALVERARERRNLFPDEIDTSLAPLTNPPKASFTERVAWHTKRMMPSRFFAQAPGREPAPIRSAEASRDSRSQQQSQNDHRFAWMMVHVLSSAEQLYSRLIRERPPDLVHCHDLDTLMAGALAKHRWGMPVVWDSHENWPYANPQADADYINFFLELERLLAGYADHVFAVSSPLLREISERTGVRNISVVPNAEIWKGEPPAPMAGAMTTLAAGRIRFLFQGSFALERGIEQVIAAWGGVDGGRAALFLRGHDNAAAQILRTYTSELGLLDKSVYFLDPVVEDDLVAASSEADIGLIPYLRRWPGYRVACPNKLSQYLHAGVPVISNELPYVREVIETGRCGAIYDSTIPGSLERLVAMVVDSPRLLADWKRNALVYSRDHFNWQRVSPEIIARYEQLLAGRRSRIGHEAR